MRNYLWDARERNTLNLYRVVIKGVLILDIHCEIPRQFERRTKFFL